MYMKDSSIEKEDSSLEKVYPKITLKKYMILGRPGVLFMVGAELIVDIREGSLD